MRHWLSPSLLGAHPTGLGSGLLSLYTSDYVMSFSNLGDYQIEKHLASAMRYIFAVTWALLAGSQMNFVHLHRASSPILPFLNYCLSTHQKTVPKPFLHYSLMPMT